MGKNKQDLKSVRKISDGFWMVLTLVFQCVSMDLSLGWFREVSEGSVSPNRRGEDRNYVGSNSRQQAAEGYNRKKTAIFPETVFFFARRPVGQCDLVLFVHTRWETENLHKFSRIWAVPILQVKQMKRRSELEQRWIICEGFF